MDRPRTWCPPRGCCPRGRGRTRPASRRWFWSPASSPSSSAGQCYLGPPADIANIVDIVNMSGYPPSRRSRHPRTPAPPPPPHQQWSLRPHSLARRSTRHRPGHYHHHHHLYHHHHHHDHHLVQAVLVVVLVLVLSVVITVVIGVTNRGSCSSEL